MLDERGVDFLGMRLIVVLIAAALLLSGVAVYVEEYAERSSMEQARREASRVDSLARAEYDAGGPGSSAPITVCIPMSVKCMVFNGTTYSIEFADGSQETRASGCRFSPAALYPGTYRLDVAVADNGSYAVLLEAARDA
ncbi:MAG TPA: hypothetical protein VMC84_05025 [Methanocella sp.]|uniref:hypothetical protein n=1 Tax=Methanocella sp. TaxID=2052833 RepID=UPI002CC33BDE|nr:hypothetical protein [Methanocella sp.]HTY90520.1 hypothetical protein [Methanocella sp.]